jgi:hypothetical protein
LTLICPIASFFLIPFFEMSFSNHYQISTSLKYCFQAFY